MENVSDHDKIFDQDNLGDDDINSPIGTIPLISKDSNPQGKSMQSMTRQPSPEYDEMDFEIKELKKSAFTMTLKQPINTMPVVNEFLESSSDEDLEEEEVDKMSDTLESKANEKTPDPKSVIR